MLDLVVDAIVHIQPLVFCSPFCFLVTFQEGHRSGQIRYVSIFTGPLTQSAKDTRKE